MELEISHEVKGFEEALEKLKQLADQETVKSALREGVKECCEGVQHAAKNMVHADTSQLRNDIAVTPLPDTGPLVACKVGSVVKQGFFEEFGTGLQGDPTVAHTTKETWRYQDKDGQWYTTSGHPPHPWLYPSVKLQQPSFVGIMNKNIKNKLKGGG